MKFDLKVIKSRLGGEKRNPTPIISKSKINWNEQTTPSMCPIMP